jgi:hypothetical protein
MIRVFLLALLGLAALAMVARNLPEALRPAPDRAVEWEADTTPLDRWDGTWAGTFITYEADGKPVSTVSRTLRYTRSDDRNQVVSITDEDSGGRTRESRQEQAFDGTAMTSRRTMEDGTISVLEGHRAGGAVTWHRKDSATGAFESYRERIVSSPEGDLLTVDGVMLTRSGAAPRLFEGRYHRLDQDRD